MIVLRLSGLVSNLEAGVRIRVNASRSKQSRQYTGLSVLKFSQPC